MIKQRLRKLGRKMAQWPLVGPIIRNGVILIRQIKFRGTSEQSTIKIKSISDLNENFVRSVPISLRQITRDQIEMRRKLEVLSDSVEYLLERLDFIGREMVAEIRHRIKIPRSDIEKIKTEVKIIDPEKLAAASHECLRVNLGCGHIALEGYINVDRRFFPGVDIVSDAYELPFEPGQLDEIFSAHLLQCFSQEQLSRELLPYYYCLLKEGGIFRAIVPDAEELILRYSQGFYSYEEMHNFMYGDQSHDGDYYVNMFTANSIKKLLVKAGFTSVQIIAASRPYGKGFEMEVSAKK